jgi:hypothetical protein
MRFPSTAIAFFLALSLESSSGFVPVTQNRPLSSSSSHLYSGTDAGVSTADIATIEASSNDDRASMMATLTSDIISKLRFRQVQKELELRQLETSGTFTDMKKRLMHIAADAGTDKSGTSQDDVLVIDEDAINSVRAVLPKHFLYVVVFRSFHASNSHLFFFFLYIIRLIQLSFQQAFQSKGIQFQDESDPDFDFKFLVDEIMDLSNNFHWKKLSRKLKKLTWTYGTLSPEPRTIPEDLFIAVMKAMMQDRLHGARAAESARRVMEEMVANGYSVPEDMANYCVKESLGYDEDGTHEGFGGIDTALAMLAAIEVSENPPTIHHDTYEKLISTMARAGSIDHSLQLLREIVVEKSNTPSLKLFADIASSIVDGKNPDGDAEKLMTALAYAKAGGYELDSIASTVDGREILAAGVIAAEKMNNIGLGLRFLTAASKAEGCDPDRGDTLVATLSPAAQRACTIIHRQAINKAVEDQSWRLAVKLLELMLERGLTPSPGVWRNVVTLCAREEKSRKATALLLDWVRLDLTHILICFRLEQFPSLTTDLFSFFSFDAGTDRTLQQWTSRKATIEDIQHNCQRLRSLW